MEKQSFTVTVAEKTTHKIVFENSGEWKGTIDGKEFSCDVIHPEKNHFHVIRDAHSYTVEILNVDAESKKLTVKVNGHTYPLLITDKFDELLHALGMDKSAGMHAQELKAPMPGLVLDIVVNVGQEVKKGETVVVLEAMKMENILKSPADVVVKKISVKKGAAVEKGQVLVSFD